MADAWRPLTWLLVAACGWALLLLIAVVAGLGNRFPLPTTTAAPRVVSLALVQTPARLGPLANYLEVGARPLLNADRRPELVAASGAGSGTDLDVSLTSVLMTPSLQMVILTGNQDGKSRRVRLGEVAEGSNWRLIRLEPRRATFERPSGEITLELRVYDGKATSAVTQVDAGAPNAPAQPEPAPANDSPAVVNAPTPAAMPPAQEQQIEAIRRRIEARRAQMRAEASKTNDDHK